MTSTSDRIPRLEEHNYHEWLVDIRAFLRREKLWKYTQEQPEDETSSKQQKDWEAGTVNAADIITPTLSSSIKKRLTEDEFNNGYLMMKRLKELLEPSGNTQFMRLCKEYFSLQYDPKESMVGFLTRVKLLEERMDATNITLTKENRILLCLSMAMPEEYQSLVQIWNSVDGIPLERAKTMLLEEEQRRKDRYRGKRRFDKAPEGPVACWTCGKSGHKKTDCPEEQPDDKGF